MLGAIQIHSLSNLPLDENAQRIGKNAPLSRGAVLLAALTTRLRVANQVCSTAALSNPLRARSRARSPAPRPFAFLPCARRTRNRAAAAAHMWMTLHEHHLFFAHFGKHSSRTHIIYQLYTSHTVHLHHTISMPNALLLVSICA